MPSNVTHNTEDKRAYGTIYFTLITAGSEIPGIHVTEGSAGRVFA